MNNQNNLAQKIINYREAQDMTQAELADKSGIERTALNISADTLLDLNGSELTWADLGMPYGGEIPDELKDTYADIARGYFKRHPEYLNKE